MADREKKVGKTKIQKFYYLKNKELFRWNKKHFSVLEGLSFSEKWKFDKKIEDTSFKINIYTLTKKLVRFYRYIVVL